MPQLGRVLILVGAILLVAGVALTTMGRIPGDVVVRRGNFTFYFPLMTSILLSIVLSVLLWLFRR
jgi:hypothetical protein